jgi:hypothetical protein
MQTGFSPIVRVVRALLFLMLSATLAAIPGELQAAIYRWVDATGREHFTMDLEQVPPQYRAAAAAAEKRSHSRMNVIGNGSSSAARSPAAAGPARVGPRLEAKKPGGHGEKWWREEHRRHRNQVEQARRSLERAGDITQYSRYYAGVGRRERAQARNDARRARGAAVRGAEERLQGAQTALADFLEGARRAGVPPGWLR